MENTSLMSARPWCWWCVLLPAVNCLFLKIDQGCQSTCGWNLLCIAIQASYCKEYGTPQRKQHVATLQCQVKEKHAFLLSKKQGGINSGPASTTWRVEQGPCEPMSACESQRESHTNSEWATMCESESEREPSEPERARVSQREQERACIAINKWVSLVSKH